MHRLEGIWIAMVISFAIGTSLSCLIITRAVEEACGQDVLLTPKDEISWLIRISSAGFSAGSI
jgi:hypothetical protein